MSRPLLLIFAAALCMVVGEDAPFHYFDHEYDRTPLGDAVDLASMRLLKEAYETKKTVVASPLGVLTLLSLYSKGAEGANRDEIIKALGSKNYDELFQSYSSLSQRFSSMDPSYLTLANKVYVAEKFDINSDFEETAVRSYRSEVAKLDFTKPAEAAAIINNWAKNKTNGFITDPVKADDLSPDVGAALFNIIFFQGHWNVPFNASETVEKDFHVDKDTVVKKPMMTLERSLFYYESPELGAKMVELPYKEPGFRMVVILPDEIDGLSALVQKVATSGILSDVFKLEPAGRDVILEMPKFEIKSGLDLNDLLPKIGVSKIFTDSASGIIKGAPLVVSKAFQEAFVKVDEEGATAGAFTGAVMVLMSSDSTPPPPLSFKVDHPFLFAILNEDKVIFVGTYSS